MQRFLHDALVVLPDPHAARVPFRRESWLEYRWGETLSFVKGGLSINPAMISGFAEPTPTGARTVSPEATLRLSAPPPNGDTVLEVEAGAFPAAAHLPEQQVSVEIIGQIVGDWAWWAGAPSPHELTIPAAVYNGGDLRLRFLITRSGSPAEAGRSNHEAAYGIMVKSVRLRTVGKN